MNIATDHHFTLAYRFFQVQAFNLIRSLAENNIRDEATVKSIVQSYLFSLGTDVDQYFIQDEEVGQKRYYPMICFRDREDIQESTEAIVPDGEDAFHETVPFDVLDDIAEWPSKRLGFTYGNEVAKKEL